MPPDRERGIAIVAALWASAILAVGAAMMAIACSSVLTPIA